MDLGVYCVYPIVALLGPNPTEVTYTPVMLETGVDGAGTLVLQYPKVVIHWWVGWVLFCFVFNSFLYLLISVCLSV